MDRKRVIPIFVIVFTNILGAGVILPILPLYAEGRFGATAFQATLLAAAFFAAQFVAAPWLGRLSDRIGRRPVLIVSQIGTVFSFVLFIFAEPLGLWLDATGLRLGIGGGLVVLYLARSLDGFTGGNITTAQAYISDISTEESRAQALGMLSAAFGLGFIFGPAFGAALAEINLIAPFVGAAFITSGSVLLTTFMLKESLSPAERRSKQKSIEPETPLLQYLSNPTITLILLISFVIILSFSALQSTFALYSERVLFHGAAGNVVARNVGLMLTFVGIVSVITQAFLIRPLIRRLGEQRTVIVGQISLAIAFAGLAVTAEPLLAVLFLAPVAFGQGVNQPSLQALITRFGTARTRGRLLGMFQSANSLALILGPVWSGYVFDYINPRAPYALAVPMLLLSIVLGLFLTRHALPEKRPQPVTS